MARYYGQILSAIWNDPDFRALTGDCQRVYLLLVTQADISSAGTLAMTIKRWSKYASDTLPDSLSDSLFRLEKDKFVVLDEDSEEVLVRSFVKWDGGATNPKRIPSIKSAAEAVVSPKIRAALKVELHKLGIEISGPDNVPDSLSNTHPDRPRVVVTERTTTHNPQPTTSNPQPATPSASAEPRKRGHRLPPDWKPSTEDIEWQRQREISDFDARRWTEKFRNHWEAASGQSASKLDWSKAWRNWCLTELERTPAGRANGQAPRVAPGQTAAWMSA